MKDEMKIYRVNANIKVHEFSCPVAVYPNKITIIANSREEAEEKIKNNIEFEIYIEKEEEIHC